MGYGDGRDISHMSEKAIAPRTKFESQIGGQVSFSIIWTKSQTLRNNFSRFTESEHFV